MHLKKILIGIYQDSLNNCSGPEPFARQGLCALTQIPDAKIAIIGTPRYSGVLENLPINAKIANGSTPVPDLLENIAQEEFNSQLKDCGLFYLIGNNALQTKFARQSPNGITVIISGNEEKYNRLKKKAKQNNRIIPAYSFFAAAVKLVCHYECNKYQKQA